MARRRGRMGLDIPMAQLRRVSRPSARSPAWGQVDRREIAVERFHARGFEGESGFDARRLISKPFHSFCPGVTGMRGGSGSI